MNVHVHWYVVECVVLHVHVHGTCMYMWLTVEALTSIQWDVKRHHVLKVCTPSCPSTVLRRRICSVKRKTQGILEMSSTAATAAPITRKWWVVKLLSFLEGGYVSTVRSIPRVMEVGRWREQGMRGKWERGREREREKERERERGSFNIMYVVLVHRVYTSDLDIHL